MENNAIYKVIKFIPEARKDLKPGGAKDFICPLCGGKAKAVMATENEHLWAKCYRCGFTVKQ